MELKNYDVYSQMCILSNELQAIKNRIGWFDQYDYIINKQTGVKLIALQLLQNKYTEDTAWLPSQNQIQSIIQQLQPNISLIVEDFEDWYKEDEYFLGSIPNITFDMLYLMYYMERYQRKFWCWGCGYWKDISEKKYERIERAAIKSKIFLESSEQTEEEFKEYDSLNRKPAE